VVGTRRAQVAGCRMAILEWSRAVRCDRNRHRCRRSNADDASGTWPPAAITATWAPDHAISALGSQCRSAVAAPAFGTRRHIPPRRTRPADARDAAGNQCACDRPNPIRQNSGTGHPQPVGVARPSDCDEHQKRTCGSHGRAPAVTGTGVRVRPYRRGRSANRVGDVVSDRRLRRTRSRLDGGSMAVRVTAAGGRSWRQRLVALG